MIYGDSQKIKELTKRYRWARDTRDSEWRTECSVLSKYLSPAHGRFLLRGDDIPARTKVDRKSIINGTATRAIAIAVAGIKGGLVPHSLKWFKLGIEDEALAKFEPVREWLATCENIMYGVYNKSNFYEAIYAPFNEQLIFGTGPILAEAHRERVVHFTPWTCGEYALLNGEDNIVDTAFRETWRTVRQLEQQFGKDKLSPKLQRMIDNGGKDRYVKVVHCIMPRDDYDPGKKDVANMPWASLWWEDECTDAILGESGYRTKPFMAPRWQQIAENPYGSDCPGLQILGDVMQLQKIEMDKLAALALNARPPINVPTSMYGRVRLYPDAQNVVGKKEEGEIIRRTVEVNFNTEQLRQEIRDVESRIKEGCFNDLFLMLIGADKSGTTAFEIAKKNEEKLVLLGPIVERQNNELLTPINERVFDICLNGGLFPPIPKEIAESGAELKIEYVSLLAQAQKAVGLSSIERGVSFIGQIAAAYPEARYKILPLEVCDEYAELTGVSPKLLRSNEEAKKMHEGDIAAQQQAQQVQQMAGAAAVAKDLSQAQMSDGQNVLDKITAGLPAA